MVFEGETEKLLFVRAELEKRDIKYTLMQWPGTKRETVVLFHYPEDVCNAFFDAGKKHEIWEMYCKTKIQ